MTLSSGSPVRNYQHPSSTPFLTLHSCHTSKKDIDIKLSGYLAKGQIRSSLTSGVTMSSKSNVSNHPCPPSSPFLPHPRPLTLWNHRKKHIISTQPALMNQTLTRAVHSTHLNLPLTWSHVRKRGHSFCYHLDKFPGPIDVILNPNIWRNVILNPNIWINEIKSDV